MCETFLLKRTPSEYLVETEGAGLENESNRALCKKEKKKKKTRALGSQLARF